MDLQSIFDEDVLENMIIATEDIPTKLTIRKRQKEIREKRFAEYEKNKTKSGIEDGIKMRLRMAEEDKQRRLHDFKSQAPRCQVELTIREDALQDKRRRADEEKQMKLDKMKMLAPHLRHLYNSTATEFIEHSQDKAAGRSNLDFKTPVFISEARKQKGFGGTAYYASRPGDVSQSNANSLSELTRQKEMKDEILAWLQRELAAYKNIEINDFSKSWSNGLALCALVDRFHPGHFDFQQLNADNKRQNFTLAINTSKKLSDIKGLDVEDMVKYKNPDWKNILAYVNQFYNKFAQKQ